MEGTDIKLCSYSGHEISVIGEGKVQVAYRDQKAVLPVVITGNDGPVLMGRDWLFALKLDWGQLKRISLEPVDELDQLRTKYSSLFDGNLRTIKGVTAHVRAATCKYHLQLCKMEKSKIPKLCLNKGFWYLITEFPSPLPQGSHEIA